MSANPFTKPSRRKDGKMNQSNLVQRLKKPWFRTLEDGTRVDNPFSFGGGLKNGGLSEDAMKLLRDIFSFDYMGAAEFEFGAVPDALAEIAAQSEKGRLIGYELTLTDKEVAADAREPKPLLLATVYVLSRQDERAEVERRIRLMAAGKESYGHKPGYLSLKEATGLARCLRGSEYADTLGWLELDNGFFFFIDKNMYEQVAKLFGVTT